MKDSRITGLHRMSIAERIEALASRGWLDPATAARLRRDAVPLEKTVADRMVENVIGVFGLPFAVAPNFAINGRDYVVPLVIEEPSVVAGLSAAARLARAGGGFTVQSADPVLAGQIHLVDVADADATERTLAAAAEDLVARANALQPALLARGGGARAIETYRHPLPGGGWTVVLHLLVDTRDAMGANLVNTMCEGIAGEVERLTSARAALRILSNLADRALVTATATVPLERLASGGYPGEFVRDAIVRATDLANADRHRAVTHNKGVMNGIDAVAIATGNDWRAVEAAAHAWAARDGAYRSLTRWTVDADGRLAGELSMPIKVGTVGGSLRANACVDIALALLGVTSATGLAEVMGAVGLAQNLAALRALVTHGIQHGHMRLHARSVAASIGTPEEHFDRVVAGLVESGDVKARKAEELLANLRGQAADKAPATEAPVREREAEASPNAPVHGRALKRPPEKPVPGREGEKLPEGTVHGRAAGKVILLGEHAAVYGRHVLALPIHDAVRVTLAETGAAGRLVLEGNEEAGEGVARHVRELLVFIAGRLGVEDREFDLRLRTSIPPAMGLGASAAVAVAIIRAFDTLLSLELDGERVNELAFECEKLAHGTPSGIDNTVAAFARPVLFRKDAGCIDVLELPGPPPLVVASCGVRGVTRDQVASVRARFERNRDRYNALFDEIDAISIAGAKALVASDYGKLGELMNICHGLLNAIQVSIPELENMVHVARTSGAIGAKLTGAGGGGSIAALAPGRVEDVAGALRGAGWRIVTTMGE